MKSQYRYKAVDEAGKNVTGVIEAEDQEAAMVALRQEFPTVKSVVNIGENSPFDFYGVSAASDK